MHYKLLFQEGFGVVSTAISLVSIHLTTKLTVYSKALQFTRMIPTKYTDVTNKSFKIGLSKIAIPKTGHTEKKKAFFKHKKEYINMLR